MRLKTWDDGEIEYTNFVASILPVTSGSGLFRCRFFRVLTMFQDKRRRNSTGPKRDSTAGGNTSGHGYEEHMPFLSGYLSSLASFTAFVSPTALFAWFVPPGMCRGLADLVMQGQLHKGHGICPKRSTSIKPHEPECLNNGF